MSDPPVRVAGMSEHKVSIEELRKKVGNAILLATTRDCRFVVTRYGVEMGAVVGHRDLQRLKKLDEAQRRVEPGGPPAEVVEAQRAEALTISILDRILLGEEVTPQTTEEWEIYFDVQHMLFKARFDKQEKHVVDVLTGEARQRRAGKATLPG